MIDIKRTQDISVMAEGGKKLGEILQKLLTMAQPGVSLLEIDTKADELINETGGTASFKTVRDYTWATCLCVNEVVVHGIPTHKKLIDGDVLTIDVGLMYKGYHTDTAWTKIVNSSQFIVNRDEKEKFLRVGEEALWKAIAQAKVGNRVGHISQAIQSSIEGAGYSIVRTLVGHGVGKALHEEPQVPGILKDTIQNSPELALGMTIAIEVIYAMGNGSVVYDNDDGWTIATKDRSRAAVFEHTVAITSKGPMILTLRDQEISQGENQVSRIVDINKVDSS